MDGYGTRHYKIEYDGNEFTGTDLSVKVDRRRFKSIGEMISGGRWKASKLLTTEQRKPCIVLWAASFPCAFGHSWTIADGWDKAVVES